jgi:hypothetical protein
MVPQVLAHVEQLTHDWHADMPEMIGMTDARQLQIAKRGDRSRDLFATRGTVTVIP